MNEEDIIKEISETKQRQLDLLYRMEPLFYRLLEIKKDCKRCNYYPEYYHKLDGILKIADNQGLLAFRGSFNENELEAFLDKTNEFIKEKNTEINRNNYIE